MLSAVSNLIWPKTWEDTHEEEKKKLNLDPEKLKRAYRMLGSKEDGFKGLEDTTENRIEGYYTMRDCPLEVEIVMEEWAHFEGLPPLDMTRVKTSRHYKPEPEPSSLEITHPRKTLAAMAFSVMGLASVFFVPIPRIYGDTKHFYCVLFSPSLILMVIATLTIGILFSKKSTDKRL